MFWGWRVTQWLESRRRGRRRRYDGRYSCHTPPTPYLPNILDCEAALPWSSPVAEEPAGSRIELCVSLHVCVLASALLAWAQLRWWQAALLHLVCFGSSVSQPLCLLFLLHVLSLLASAASLSGRFIETAPRHWRLWG